MANKDIQTKRHLNVANKKVTISAKTKTVFSKPLPFKDKNQNVYLTGKIVLPPTTAKDNPYGLEIILRFKEDPETRVYLYKSIKHDPVESKNEILLNFSFCGTGKPIKELELCIGGVGKENIDARVIISELIFNREAGMSVERVDIEGF